MPTLSVVIPATDRSPTLARALEAVRLAAGAPEEVIVVDRPASLGPAAARNQGAAEAAGDVLVFVDADVEVHGDAFERIRDAFDSDPGLTALFGSYDDDPGGGSVVSDFRNLLHHHVHHANAGPATTFWAGLGAVRRDAFLRSGGFDEQRFRHASVEDIDLGMRLHRDGARIVLDPLLQGKHLKRWTLVAMIQTDLVRRGVPWLRLMLDDRAHSTSLNLGWRHRAGSGSALLLVAALLRRNLRLAVGILGVLAVLDRAFYGLLLRRRGVRHLAAGFVLHVIHRLTAVAAVPIALVGHLRHRRGQR